MNTITAEDVRAAREWLDETQEEFARRLGITRAALAKWETDGPPRHGGGRVLLEWLFRELENGKD